MVKEVWPRSDPQGFRETTSRPLRLPQEARRLRGSHHSGLRGRISVISTTKEDEERALADLQSSFSIKDLGDISYPFGCHVSRDRNVGTVTLDQRQYAKKLIERFEIVETSKIPVATGTSALSKAENSENKDKVNEMRKAVGALMWIAIMAWLHLSFAAHNVAKLSDNPGPAHWKALKRTTHYGIVYEGTS
ncbi:unnamed protein product [Sphacelaria rigidula]